MKVGKSSAEEQAMRSKAARRGYTWIELLVTIGVIFFLAALRLATIRQMRGPRVVVHALACRHAAS